jgi:hypothetical protein
VALILIEAEIEELTRVILLMFSIFPARDFVKNIANKLALQR